MNNPLIHSTGRDLLPTRTREPHEYTIGQPEYYFCATCQQRVGISLMRSATECAACHERKKSLRSSPSSPLASDGPESAGWAKVPIDDPSEECVSHWTKGDKHLWEFPNGRMEPQENWDGPYDWESIDAKLFPTVREFRKGDLVECLPDEYADQIHERKFHLRGKQREISYMSHLADRKIVAAAFICNNHPGSPHWNWPVRALRLIRAVEEK